MSDSTTEDAWGNEVDESLPDSHFCDCGAPADFGLGSDVMGGPFGCFDCCPNAEKAIAAKAEPIPESREQEPGAQVDDVEVRRKGMLRQHMNATHFPGIPCDFCIAHAEGAAEAEARIVAWLRSRKDVNADPGLWLTYAAVSIENGEHRA